MSGQNRNGNANKSRSTHNYMKGTKASALKVTVSSASLKKRPPANAHSSKLHPMLSLNKTLTASTGISGAKSTAKV